MDVDIVIKATGFHINDAVPKISGYTKQHHTTHLDFNVAYQAEPLLDGAQFGSAKGMRDSSELRISEAEEVIRANMDKLKDLPPFIHGLFQGQANPFGSGYVGGAQ